MRSMSPDTTLVSSLLPTRSMFSTRSDTSRSLVSIRSRVLEMIQRKIILRGVEITDTSGASIRVESCLRITFPLSIPKPILSRRSNKVTTISFVTDDSCWSVRPILRQRDGPYLVLFQERFNRVLVLPDNLLFDSTVRCKTIDRFLKK